MGAPESGHHWAVTRDERTQKSYHVSVRICGALHKFKRLLQNRTAISGGNRKTALATSLRRPTDAFRRGCAGRSRLRCVRLCFAVFGAPAAICRISKTLKYSWFFDSSTGSALIGRRGLCSLAIRGGDALA